MAATRKPMTGKPITRRTALAGGAGMISLALASSARATPATMAAAIRDFTGGVEPLAGGMSLTVPELVENGNAVPLTVSVDSAMAGADFVKAIAIFNERNPLPQVIVFRFGPLSGRAACATRIRLGDSQRITAIAAMADGTFRAATADLVVTLPACVEE